MKTAEDLKQQIYRNDGKSYAFYKELRGTYQFRGYRLSLDRIQGDPFAPPSSLSASVSFEASGIPKEYIKYKHRRIALQDFLTRKLWAQLSEKSFRAKGSGKSGLLSTSHCGQTILERTACQITQKEIIMRFYAGFPANGRRISGRELEKMLFRFLPEALEKAVLYKNLNAEDLKQTIELSDDQQYIRTRMEEENLCAFVADGSVLPRESGVSDKPMKDSVLFRSPKSLKVIMNLPHKGELSGMGIPRGITLITGGGYHGKSTLLQALQEGVYNHIPKDGREYVLTDETAVKLRSEDGRFIRDTDISLFINDLPNGKNTKSFSTSDASGSTSQAAGIAESMEAGSRLLLIDEDTSATNFMVRDALMQEVINRISEPITPFTDRAKQLWEEAGISTILVAGSSGAFFYLADTILQMTEYEPEDITEKAKEICRKYANISQKPPTAFRMPESRRVMSWPEELTAEKKKHKPLKIKAHGKDGFSIGKNQVDLRYTEQITDSEQTAALGKLLLFALENLTDGRKTIKQIGNMLDQQIQEQGLESFFSGNAVCGYAAVRRQELFACLNRFRR